MSTSTNFFQDLVSGTAGGVAGIVVGQPADTVKVRAQVAANSNPLRILKQIIRREGAFSLFRGMCAPIVANMPINATIFVVYGNSIRYFAEQQQSEIIRRFNSRKLQRQTTGDIVLRNKTIDRSQEVQLHPKYHFMAGCIGGLIQSVFACPNELIKIKQQVGQSCSVNSNTWSTMKLLVREGGLRRGLFQGMALTCARDVPAFGVYFSSYEIVKSWMESRGWNLTSAAFSAGAVAGINSFALLHPFDVLKSNRQMQPISTPASETTMIAIASKGYKEMGYKFFFKGFTPSVLRAGPVSAVIFVVYEQVMALMKSSEEGFSFLDDQKFQKSTTHTS